ncbi:MAG: GNAT family N-acetyltransferase [bacterium]
MFKIEKATLKDVGEIHKLIGKYAQKGFMLYRPVLEIEYKIRDYFVCRVKNKVVGCVALRVWNKRSSEIYALAVDSDYTGQHIGTNLIKNCINEAKKVKVESVFTLTFKQDLFRWFGFKKINLRDLPKVIFTEKTVNIDKAYGMKL